MFTSGVADDDFLRVNGTAIEGRSASEVLSDIGASAVAGSSSIVTTGALDSGSITSGFGTIDTGSSNITSTGVGTFGSLDISGDIDIDGTTNLDVVDIDGTLNVAGETTLQTHLNMGDGDIIKFGASADLQISHTGSFSKIADSGTGNLILACQDFALTNPAVGENMITAAVDGAVTLYHNNVAKIATASTGVTSAGTYIGTAAGSASAPNFAVTSGSLGANGMFVPAANTLAFSNSGTERMRIDSSGRVGIGTTENGNYHANNDDLAIVTSGSTGITIASGTTDQGRIAFADGTGSGSDAVVRGLIMYNHNGNVMSFNTNSQQRFQIDSAGRASFVDTVDIPGIIVQGSIGSGGIARQTTASGSHTYIANKFRNSSGTEVGTISVGTSATAYNTSSDYRLKENVSYSFDATSRLKQLKPARFNFISDADITVDGFIAHEVSSIVPEAITGTKDATESMANVVLNADGTWLTDDVTQEKWVEGKADETYASDTTWVASQTVPSYQSIDQAKLVPLLVKTIQELEARITALEGA